jgi:hypothetical protein
LIVKYLKFVPVIAIIVAVAVGALNFSRINAAGSGTLYTTPSSGSYKVGSIINVTFRENSGETKVNAVSVNASYNTSLLQFQSFNFSSSSFEVAAVSSGAGGNIRMDRGTTNHTLVGDQEVGRASFKVLATGTANITINGSSVVVTHDDNVDQIGTKTGSTFTLQSAFENRVAHRPDGRGYYFSQNERYSIPNPAVRNCIMVRNSTGEDFLTSDAEVDSFADAGAAAHCPYEKEPGLNFLKENDAPTIWLVNADGTKQHVGSLCVNDPFTTVLKKFHVFIVPASELAGHVVGPDWFASGSACAALPG